MRERIYVRPVSTFVYAIEHDLHGRLTVHFQNGTSAAYHAPAAVGRQAKTITEQQAAGSTRSIGKWFNSSVRGVYQRADLS